jgi:pimeloyl-ACP methyl ester carboxylesterase
VEAQIMVQNAPNTVDLAYGEAGHGPPVLLLHGLGSSRNDWLMQLLALVPRCRIVAVDLRGHGLSPKPSGPYRMEMLAADVAQLLARIDARPAHIIGISLGGAVAQQVALDAPHLTRSLLLVNTAARFVSSDWRQRLLGARRLAGVYLGSMDRTAQAVADRLFPWPEQAALRRETAQRIAANDLHAYRATLWAIARFDVRDRLGEIRCPTLVVAGDADSTVPLAAKRLLAERIPGSRLDIIPRSGHATPVDQPEAFNQVMLRYLDEVETGQ